MNARIFFELLDNAELLLVLVVIYEIGSIFLSKYRKIRSLLSGIMIGLIGIVIMSLPYEFMSGLVFDTRSILISATAITFSLPSLIISALIMLIYRIYLGGVGVLPGILVITSISIFGLLWNHFIFKRVNKLRWLNIYVYGLLSHSIMLICMLALPHDIAINTLKEVTGPVLIIYPIVTLLISELLLYQIERDFTNQKVKDAEERYHNLFENKQAVMFIIDPKTSLIVDANEAAVEQYGYTKEEFCAMDLSRLNTLSKVEVQRITQRVKDLGEKSIVFKHRRKDGSIFDVEIFSGPIQFEKKIYIYLIAIDITDRVKAIHALENSEARFRLVVDHAPDAIFILSNYRFAFLNNSALDLFGAKTQDEILYTWVLDRLDVSVHQKIRNQIEEIFKSDKKVLIAREKFITIDNRSIEVDLTLIPINYEGIQSILVFVRELSSERLKDI